MAAQPEAYPNCVQRSSFTCSGSPAISLKVQGDPSLTRDASEQMGDLGVLTREVDSGVCVEEAGGLLDLEAASCSRSHRSRPHSSNSCLKYPNRAGVIACRGNEGAISRKLE